MREHRPVIFKAFIFFLFLSDPENEFEKLIKNQTVSRLSQLFHAAGVMYLAQRPVPAAKT